MLKEKTPYQPRIASPTNLPFRNGGKIKSLSNQQKLYQIITLGLALQEML
jgi:hypothetical protein